MDSSQSNEGLHTNDVASPSNIKENVTFCLEELCSDDEIYTLQCPENFSDLSLIEKKLNSKHSNEIENQSEMECYVYKTRKRNLTLAIPSKNEGGSLINLNCKGHIIVKKIVTPSSSVENEILDDTEYKIPKAKKEKLRHPLLGVDWKSHLDTVDSAITKIQLKTKNTSENKKRKKKKKEKSSKNHNKEVYSN